MTSYLPRSPRALGEQAFLDADTKRTLKRYKPSEREKQVIRDLAAAGWTQKRIAKIAGCSVAYVCQLLKAAQS
jgi:DNA-directed RNA polymerase specialized sigma subunit